MTSHVTVRPEELVPRRGTLVRTRPASPSALGLLELCPLSYLMQTEATPRKTIGLHPSALLGTAVHVVTSSMIATGVPAPQVVVEKLKDEFLRLASDPERSTTLARWMLHHHGIEGFVARRQLVERSAYAINVASRLPHIPIGRRAGPGAGVDGGVPVGSERWLESVKSGIAGKIDLILRTPPGGVRIIDFKTGKVYEEDGQVKRGYALQMAAYARMVEDIEPAANVQLELVGKAEAWSSPFDQGLRAMIDSALAGLQSILPLGHEVRHDQVAVLGTHCARCSSRPSCRVYGNELSRQTLSERNGWTNDALDISGQVKDMRVDAGLATLVFEDRDGARARIVGIPAVVIEEAGIDVGREFRAYALATSETLRDGSFPRNFFVVDSTSPRRSAFQATFAATESASA